ncbi:hemin uptake protein HemP [Mycetohabitans sp. B8]|uniref:hemin uptake protein HemP n=1 Tax=Mycetohabitans sp. B8 TaxID=2841845 RepID=UPI001F3E50A6|nr:hemin uptake protein HemP [Mycetohabitans sp. B8]MCG1042158.1 hemin uptake protein HemP [Mycetohabitans sp. B8]
MTTANRSPSTLYLPSGTTTRPMHSSTAQPGGRRAAPALTTPAPQPLGTAYAAHALQSDDLLQGRTHVSILHNGETYQLRATRLGKLILTK